jgi:predicted ATPase
MCLERNNNNDIIVFSGSHCTGKTTLINRLLVKYGEFKSLDKELVLTPSAFNDIKLANIDLLEKQSLLIQREQAILNSYDSCRNSLILKDRGFVDTLIYSKYFYEQESLSLQDYQGIERQVLNLLDLKPYSIIYILPTLPSISFIDRDKFAMDETSRERINTLFLEFYEEYKEKYNIKLLCMEDLEERVTYIYNNLNLKTL